MSIAQLTEEGMLQLGLEQHNLHYRATPTEKQQQAQVRNFRKFYGVNPKTCLDLLKAVQKVNDPVRIRKEKASPYDLLMTVEWLWEYATDFKMAAKYGVSESTFSATVWHYTRAIQALKMRKIKWLWSNQVHGGEIIIVSVDGVHCTISEPRTMPSSKWYSHKSHGPALAYEIAIAVQHNNVVHINGPFPAGLPDISIYRKEDGLKSKMPEGKYATADRGYLGEPMLRTPNPCDTQLARDFKKRSQARHETFNSRLKSFKILSTRFRHSHNPRKSQPVTCHDKHKAAFEAVCVVLQYDMENGHPLFAV
jgi:hypothetical protein